MNHKHQWTGPGWAVGLALLATACQDPSSWEGFPMASHGAVREGESIQDAIDDADPGETVPVEAGHYTENLTLRVGVNLAGAGADVTVLHGSIDFDGEGDEELESVISGLHITAEGADLPWRPSGIYARSGRAIITDCVVEGFFNGLRLEYAWRGQVLRNVLTRNTRGLTLSETVWEQLISNNQFLYNGDAGIALHTDAEPMIVHNTFIGNGFGSDFFRYYGAGLSTNTAARDTTVNNIFVSNNGGINRTSGPSVNNHHNLIWGNMVDHVNDSVPGEGDLSGDPLFVAAAAGDFRLLAGSPAIDAGTTMVTAETDFDGTLRPQGAGVDMGAFEFSAPAGSVSVVISEVMANPVDEDRGEYVEIYNASETPFDLADTRLTDGDVTDVVVALDGGTIVAAGSYAVIIDPEYVGGYDIPEDVTVVTLANTTVGNGLSTTDPITLYGSDGVTALATYRHPFDPGNGVSAERLDLEAPDLDTNWRPSPCTQSAGRPNCAPVTLAEGLIISEVMSNPLDERQGEFIEIYNGTEESINAGLMTISDGDGTDEIVGWDGGDTNIPARTYAVILDPDWPAEHMVYVDPSAILLTVTDRAIGNGLAVDDPINLLSADGEVVDTYTRALIVANGRSVEKVSMSVGDLRDNWAQSSCDLGSSPGYLNCVSSASSGPRLPLVITEVMANPLNEDTGEFIELYNRGIDPVDALGLLVNDGDAVDTIRGYADGSTVIPAGGYALIVDAEYADDYDIPASTVLLTTPDTTIGSSLGLEDPIRLLASNGIEIIDTFRYPFNPGNGVSAERIDVRGFDSADNWTASTCESRSSPGEHNCAASETGLPKQLRITEVMSNQTGTEADGAGEFVELLNVGERSVDLDGMWVSIGPEGGTTRDEIVPFEEEGTIVAPGAFAVIVDRQYDGRYDFPPGTVIATVDDNNFGSSGMATTHLVTMYDIDGITLLDAFRYPSDPGDGVSLYRVSLTVIDSADNWAGTPCGATPGLGSCPGSHDVTSFTSFWADQNMSEGGIYWYQAIGYPEWYAESCEEFIVCPTSLYDYTYRENFPAPLAFEFRNPYDAHSVLFQERSSPTHTCDPCETPTVTVGPGEVREVPASALGYYYAQTIGPRLNSFDWFEGDPDRYWALPPDGILAPFTVEVPLP